MSEKISNIIWLSQPSPLADGDTRVRERIMGLDKVPQEVTIRAKIQVSQFPGLCTLHYYTL